MAALDARSLLTRETILFPDAPTPRSGRHRQNDGRLEIGMVGAIRSERWAASDRNTWAAYVRIRSLVEPLADGINRHDGSGVPLSCLSNRTGAMVRPSETRGTGST